MEKALGIYEIVHEIILHLEEDIPSLYAAQRVNRQWRDIVNSSIYFRNVNSSPLIIRGNKNEELDMAEVLDRKYHELFISKLLIRIIINWIGIKYSEIIESEECVLRSEYYYKDKKASFLNINKIGLCSHPSTTVIHIRLSTDSLPNMDIPNTDYTYSSWKQIPFTRPNYDKIRVMQHTGHAHKNVDLGDIINETTINAIVVEHHEVNFENNYITALDVFKEIGKSGNFNKNMDKHIIIILNRSCIDMDICSRYR